MGTRILLIIAVMTAATTAQFCTEKARAKGANAERMRCAVDDVVLTTRDGRATLANDQSVMANTSPGKATPSQCVHACGAELNVKCCGAKGDGITNDWLPIQAALKNGTGGVRIPPGQYNLGSTGLVVPRHVHRLIMEPGSQLLYSGTGTAVVLDSIVFGEFELAVARRSRRLPADWYHGKDNGSIGIQLRNCRSLNLRANGVYGFWTGIQFLGDGAGVNFITLHPEEVARNMVGVSYVTRHDGWVTQNNIYGGTIKQDLESPPDGTMGIDLCDGDTTVVSGTNLEGGRIGEALRICQGYNTIIGTRHEAGRAGSVHLTKTSHNNMLINLYGLSTPDNVLRDEGNENTILTTRQFKSSGTNLNPALLLRQLVDDSTALVRLVNMAGVKTLELTTAREMLRFFRDSRTTLTWNNTTEQLTVGSRDQSASIVVRGGAMPTIKAEGPGSAIGAQGAGSPFVYAQSSVPGSARIKLQSVGGASAAAVVGTETNHDLEIVTNAEVRGSVKKDGRLIWNGTIYGAAGGTVPVRVPVPKASSDRCTAGSISWDQEYLYMCVGANTWIRFRKTPW